MNRALNIVSFDVPYPPDYGGATEVFYKLKALSEAGVKIYLHTFEYGRGKQPELEKYCEGVFYYPRDKSFFKGLHLTPFIVQSRKSKSLIDNLNKVQAPVLFEGIHTTYPLKSNRLNAERTLVRMHNMEDRYYHGLSKSEPNFLKKLSYRIESLKLKRYQRLLKKCDQVLSISPSDQQALSQIPGVNSSFLPAFHPNEKVLPLEKKGYFALVHGDLSVWDNLKAARYLADVFGRLDLSLIIAGRTKDKKLLQKVEAAKNIQFITIKDEEHLMDLIRRAHINVIWSENSEGIKIKLLNALFNGRFCLVNSPVAKGSGLEGLCEVADDEKTLIFKLIQLMDREFSKEMYLERVETLKPYDKKRNTELLLKLLYP